ncbi:TonB-dependent receptor plug domain-containing protein [Sphingomonas sp. CLY1604]|uniref:TonB-dependent receptor plug domain-containing protein n=1 Tax=Sphingomonas sp. CLY1604 TaxID=3457786 RepID=UPI003FD7D0B5
MTTMNRLTRKAALLAAATPFALLCAGAAPAAAQETGTILPTAPQTTAPADANVANNQPQEQQGADIVVTGTLLRTEVTPSPVTVVTAENLDQRGISTVQEGIQRLASNNGPALTNSFSANGAFASGASAISLRGLSTNSTLVLFDGMRAAYYPLADDGTRNFVDLNTIPDDIVENIQVLRDGASSTYGADAIAGVVNIITKKQITGVKGRAEAGISERGDASQYRLSLTAGIGDLDKDGYNAYISGFYYRQAQLFNRQRPYPYNSDDYRGISNNGVQGSNNVVNGLDADGNYQAFNPIVTSTGTNLYVAPSGPGLTNPVGRYQLLNPSTGCIRSTAYNLTAADLAANPLAPRTVCQEDLTQNYGVINPQIQRFGASARFTARFGDSNEVFATANFIQTDVANDGNPAVLRGNAPAPFYFPRYSTQGNIAFYGNNTILQLPVYVCPRGTTVACTAANGTLNPNNPFAASGQTAALLGRLPNLQTRDETRTRGYRGALGIKGDISDKWRYNVTATGMHVDLERRSTGYVYIQHLLDLINDGTLNFINPAANSQATLNYLAPEARNTATSDLVQADATINGDLFQLPGGPFQVAAGVGVRYEAVDAPSINSDINGGTQRYYTLNGFATKGSRTVYSAYGEVNAPIIDQIVLSAGGRYDRYPNGIDNFSPKFGAIVKPIRQVTLRGTYSRGFRIPSFGEANATFPTTGYVTASANTYPDSYLANYGCSQATFSTCPTYVRTASYGATSLSNANLKPEKSRSFTGGIVLQPTRNITLSAEYYNIVKTDVITTANNAPAILAYYTGQAIPAGYNVIPDVADSTPRPAGTLPRIAFVQSGFINANTLRTSGLDFGIDANFRLGNGIRFSTNAEATYILKLETEFPDGSVERYDGTLGNFNLTAGSGTPKWKGVWTSTLDFGDFLLSGTANYFDGYDLSAMDQGTGYKDCGLNDGSLPCRVSSYVTVDLTAQVRVNDQFTFYTTVQNIADRLPPIDTVTYGAHAYNPVQGGEGILGRYFKAGVKVGF